VLPEKDVGHFDFVTREIRGAGFEPKNKHIRTINRAGISMLRSCFFVACLLDPGPIFRLRIHDSRVTSHGFFSPVILSPEMFKKKGTSLS